MSVELPNSILLPSSVESLATLAPPGGADRGAFSQVLQDVRQMSDPDKARQAVNQFVSDAFIAPVLESVRESPFRTGPFAPGAAERRFGSILDQKLADEIVTAASFPLVDAILERYSLQSDGGGEAREWSDDN